MLAARTRLGAPDLYQEALAAPLPALVAGLSGVREHAQAQGEVCVADPYAQVGDLLAAVLDRVGEEGTPVVLAAEPDPFLGRFLRRRLTVRDITELTVRVGDEPAPHHAPPDVLVTQLPYQPSEDRDALDSLELVHRLTEELAPGQTAVVLGPADLLVGSLPPYRPAARTRNALLAEGRVEAVIALPGGLVPYRPAYQTALWVLRREDPSPWRGRVLLADVSGRPLTATVVDELVWDVTTWRREGHRPGQHLRAHAAEVAVSELLAPRVPLNSLRPRRMRDLTAPPQAVARVLELEADLGAATGPPDPLHSGLAVREEPAPAPRRSLGALARDGWLSVRKGYRIAEADVTSDGHHPVLGAPELTGAEPVGGRRVDRGVLAERYPRVRFTEPGDVVVTLTPGLGVYLDRDGFHVVEFPARVLRIADAARHRLTPRVLAALLAALPQVGQSSTRAAGAVRPPAKLTDVPLPVLAAAEVTRLDIWLTALDARRRRAHRELTRVDELCRITVTGLAGGTLTMAGPPGSRRDR